MNFLQFQLFFFFRQAVQGRNVQNAPVSQQPGGNGKPPVTDEPQVSPSRHPLADGFAVGFVKMGTVGFFRDDEAGLPLVHPVVGWPFHQVAGGNGRVIGRFGKQVPVRRSAFLDNRDHFPVLRIRGNGGSSFVVFLHFVDEIVGEERVNDCMNAFPGRNEERISMAGSPVSVPPFMELKSGFFVRAGGVFQLHPERDAGAVRAVVKCFLHGNGDGGSGGRFCVERENIECRKKEEAEEQP